MKVTIITPSYLSSSPRVVKEADALIAAGHEVTVVAAQGDLEDLRQFDQTLLSSRSWKARFVGWSRHRRWENWRFYYSGIRQAICQRLPLWLVRWNGLLIRAEGRLSIELGRLARRTHAELYIAHYPTGLAAAVRAAGRQARFCYDAEDYHAGEYTFGKPIPRDVARRIQLERRYLPRCFRVTTSSELIAHAMVETYSIPCPTVIHNVFPWVDRARLDSRPRDRQGPALSLFWFSQTLGSGRGLEDAIRAVGRIKEPVQLHFRGKAAEPVKQALLALAERCRIRERVHFHPYMLPDELLSRAVEHDIGLALEPPDTLNHQLFMTNKLFFYFLAGLAVIATDIPGQRDVLARTPGTGFLYQPGDDRRLSEIIKMLMQSPELLRQCKAASLKGAEEQWCWEREQARFLEGLG